ncbi:MAG TPA: hypothetical protein VE093_14650 [Polyangiaceae bacterium]|nr:hypothetical protein [Polyangiaceae bacterium]
MAPQQLLTGVDQLASGDGFLCAVKMDRSLWCWGSNAYGQLGLGDNVARATPTKVGALADVVGLSLGGGHTCVLRSDEKVYCWGANGAGQLGLGHYATTNQMTGPVQGLPGNVAAMSGGGAYGQHTCAITADGGTWCWGNNNQYQLGSSSVANSNTAVPVTSEVLGSPVAVARTYNGSCAIRSNGAAVCWGMFAGNGTLSAQAAPVQVVNF